MSLKGSRVFVLAPVAAVVLALSGWADTLQMKDGRQINGTFQGATKNTIKWRGEGSKSIHQYNVNEVQSVMFTGGAATEGTTSASHGRRHRGTTGTSPSQPAGGTYQSKPPATSTTPPTPPEQSMNEPMTGTESQTQAQSITGMTASNTITIPSGTRIVARMVDTINSDVNRVGDRFHCVLDEDLVADGKTIASKGSDCYGRLVQTSALTSSSQLGTSGSSMSSSSQYGSSNPPSSMSNPPSSTEESSATAGTQPSSSSATNSQSTILQSGSNNNLALELTEIVINGQSQMITSSNVSAEASATGQVNGALADNVLRSPGAAGGTQPTAGVASGATAAQVQFQGNHIFVPSDSVLEFRLQQPWVLQGLQSPSTP